MPPNPPRRRVGLALAGLACVAALIPFAPSALAEAAPAAAPEADGLYVDPNSQVKRWVAANPGDSRQPVIADRIASQPQARWFANFRPDTVQQEVSDYVTAAGDKIPVMSVYGITNRDCGGPSSGGAPDLTAYQGWIEKIAAGLGDHPVLIILETDSLALQTCLNPDELAARNAALHKAVTTLKSADPAARVYLDGGHSGWNSAADQAARLKAAGVTDADGVYTNVSNFNPTDAEVAYGKQILAAIGDQDLGLVVDTSRNGNGSNGEWCDPQGRALGQNPALAPGDAAVDAYLWVKPPGEADGCAAQAGQFDPALAYALATN
ncbi:glycoside hydrolase family 6 protein [Streptomyces boninensis]|uniref:glycoside hydrolase family 6 protein n=1 Tax=Streptomyces boninensis TaxID=2039455 RepID=UPI003B225853